VLVIPHGRYDLYPDSAIKKTYFISNTSSETECPSKVKTIGLLFEGIRNLRIEGDGSLLVFHGKMTTIVIDHCDGFTLTDLAEDFARPTMSEFTVTRASDTAIDVRVHPDSWHRLDSGRLTWYGEDWTARTISVSGSTLPMPSFMPTMNMTALLRSVITEPTPGMLHFSGTYDHSRFPTGSVFTVRDPVRDEVGAFLVDSKNIPVGKCKHALYAWVGHYCPILGEYFHGQSAYRTRTRQRPDDRFFCRRDALLLL
jgi:hypothetical protein